MDVELKNRIRLVTDKFMSQDKSFTVVPPNKTAPGFWFGAGNMLEVNQDLILCGRYRNNGDSRTGLNMGERGLEWAAFLSSDKGQNWNKIISRDKESLSTIDRKVISIEGSTLFKTDNEYVLIISTEKVQVYPQGLENFQKANTGVWSLDIIRSETLKGLETAPVIPFIQSQSADKLHVKDPSIFITVTGELKLLFSHHPYNWASSNTGIVSIKDLNPDTKNIDWSFLPRGNTWDVAISRGTTLWNIPQTGVLKNLEPLTLLMYDGGECMLPLKDNKGYSCEEIGGSAIYSAADLTFNCRISLLTPQFKSPYGTGCSRYVSLFETSYGVFCLWQQSGKNEEQALVMNFVSNEEINTILS